LGESHYTDWSDERHDLPQSMTRDCVQETIDREEDVSGFWKYIEQAVTNERRVNGWAPNGGGPLWEMLAFYNFVQSAVDGRARKRPAYAQFESSRPAFRRVLEVLQPERIWVSGRTLWRNMEKRPITTTDKRLEAYRLENGKYVWCLATNHVSSGRFSWSEFHPILMKFLDNPEDALALLAEIPWV
jgi:hypothetical protein